MAIDKSKIIQQAQKHIQGQKWDKAIECYEQLAKIEPKDTRVRQKIAELYYRKGDIAKALQSYSLVADSYTREGFYQKSLAVYKQMLQIKPDFVPAYEHLADVSIKLGLTNDAINYIKVVIAHYEKEGKVLEALDAIKKLIEIDPGNIASQIKLAELYAREGHREDAIRQLNSLVPGLEQSQNWDDLIRIRERMAAFDPEHTGHIKVYYKLLMRLGRYQPAFQGLQRYLKTHRNEVEAIEDLSILLRELGNAKHEKVALKELARLLGENADPARLEQIYTRILEIDPEDQGASEYLHALQANMTTEDEMGDETAHEDVDVAGEEMIGSEDGEMIGDDDGMVDDDIEIAGQEHLDTMLVGASGAEIAADQIDAYLTEADVYVKYGLIDKAVTHLQRLIASQPDCIPAYHKMREVLMAGSRGGEFAGIVNAGADAFGKAGGDPSSIHALLSAPAPAQRVAPAADIDPDVAAIVAESAAMDEGLISDELANAVGGALDAQLGGNAGGEVPTVEPDAELPPDEEMSIEIDIDAHGAPAAAGAADRNPLAGADLESDLNFNTPEEPSLELAIDEPPPAPEPAPAEAHLDGGSLEADIADEAVPEPPGPPPPTLEAEAELASGPPPDFDDTTLDGDMAAPPPQPPAAQPQAAKASPAPVLKPPVIQKPAISKPPVIQKPVIPRPPVPGPAVPKPVAAPAVKPPAIARPELPKPGIVKPVITKPEPGKPLVVPKPALKPPSIARPSIVAPVKPGVQTPAALKTPLAGKAPLPKLAPLSKPGAAGLPRPALKPPAFKPLAPRPIKLPTIQKEPFTEELEQADFEIQQGLFDEARITLDMILAQEPNHPKAKAKLNELVAAEKATREEKDGVFTPEFGGGEQVSVESVLKAFQTGVDKTVAKEDSQTRFDLGLAYREMGLFSEAEREFRLALDGVGARRPDCWSMIGLCQIDQGNPAAAAESFEQGLGETHEPEVRCNMAYELANAKMALGDKEGALGLLVWIDQEKPGFRHTGELIAQLRLDGATSGPTPPPAPDSGPGSGTRANVSYV